MEGEIVEEMELHTGEVIHMTIVNDTLLTVGSDNKMVKFDLLKNEKVGLYKSKFGISAIWVLIPE